MHQWCLCWRDHDHNDHHHHRGANYDHNLDHHNQHHGADNYDSADDDDHNDHEHHDYGGANHHDVDDDHHHAGHHVLDDEHHDHHHVDHGGANHHDHAPRHHHGRRLLDQPVGVRAAGDFHRDGEGEDQRRGHPDRHSDLQGRPEHPRHRHPERLGPGDVRDQHARGRLAPDHRLLRRRLDLQRQHFEHAHPDGEVRHDHIGQLLGQPVGVQAVGDFHRHGDREQPGLRHADGAGDLQGRRNRHHQLQQSLPQPGPGQLRHVLAQRGVALHHRHLRRQQHLQPKHVAHDHPDGEPVVSRERPPRDLTYRPATAPASSARAITMRWTSPVPSPISPSFASRM